jgi:hypothetical protein
MRQGEAGTNRAFQNTDMSGLARKRRQNLGAKCRDRHCRHATEGGRRLAASVPSYSKQGSLSLARVQE